MGARDVLCSIFEGFVLLYIWNEKMRFERCKSLISLGFFNKKYKNIYKCSMFYEKRECGL